MMRSILIGSVLLTTTSFAVATDSGPGCGWGSMLFEGSSGTPSHVVAATTNGFLGNNTFGMTSGTNGCNTSRPLDYRGSSALISHNMDRLSNDIAKGDGEMLSSVAIVMGIQEQDIPTFKQVMHENFNTLYPSSEVTSDQVLDSMISVMSKNATLEKYV